MVFELRPQYRDLYLERSGTQSCNLLQTTVRRTSVLRLISAWTVMVVCIVRENVSNLHHIYIYIYMYVYIQAVGP